MAAIATRPHIPVEIYLRSSYEPDAEYVDGEVEQRPMGEYDHASWQQAIQRWFLQNEQRWNIRVRPELRIRVSAARYRVPDVTVLDRNLPIEQVITHPPVAVFEVLSPEDTMMRITNKLLDYAAMGIPHIWVIDPKTKKAWRFRDNGLKLSSTFGAPGEKLHFEIAEIEKLLD